MNKQRLLDMVVGICKEHPSCADDDALLLSQVWGRQQSKWQSHEIYELLRSVSRPESVSRRRREAHQAGLIDYSKEAEHERFEAFKKEKYANHAVKVDLEL